MALFIFIIIYIIASIGDSISWEKSRQSAIRSGCGCYWSKQGLRDSRDNHIITYEETYRTLEMDMYRKLYANFTQNVPGFKEQYPTLRDYVKFREDQKRIG